MRQLLFLKLVQLFPSLLQAWIDPERFGEFVIACREIIDGQQRLTTLQILLKAAEHVLTEVQARALAANAAAAPCCGGSSTSGQFLVRIV